MTAYYILAPTFGFLLAGISIYGIRVNKSFPTGSIVPLVALAAVLFVATLTAAIAGGIAEDESDSGVAPAAATQTQ